MGSAIEVRGCSNYVFQTLIMVILFSGEIKVNPDESPTLFIFTPLFISLYLNRLMCITDLIVLILKFAKRHVIKNYVKSF